MADFSHAQPVRHDCVGAAVDSIAVWKLVHIQVDDICMVVRLEYYTKESDKYLIEIFNLIILI